VSTTSTRPSPGALSPLHRSRVLAALLGAVAVGLLVEGRAVRTGEAGLQTVLLHLAGQESAHVGTAALFRVQGALVGVSFTTGCSIGPVLAVFLGATAVAAAVRPLSARRVATSTLVLVGLFVLVNQLRVVVIVASMRWLGVARGYDLSHVFLGSIITTLGFLLAVVLFVRLLLAESGPSAPAHRGHRAGSS
jgi:exosortase/archaeosortase family protein